MSRVHARRPRRLVAAFAGVLAFSGTAFAVANPAAASPTLQPVSVVPSVNGVAGAPAYTSQQTTVSFAVTNGSTTGARLDSFTIVVPPGLSPVTNGGVTAPTAWNETILKCGIVPRCSALVVLNAKLPLKTNTVLPGGTVTATISFKTPATPGTLLFPLLGIGGGIFTVSGPTPSVQVLDGSATHFDVAVAPPVTAGTPSGIVVTALNVANAVVPFNGGSVTATLSAADALATIQGTGVTGGTSATVSVPAAPSGTFTLSGLFTKAQSQSVQIHSGILDGTSNTFTVQSGPPARLQITGVADTSHTPALPEPGREPAVRRGLHAVRRLRTTWPRPLASRSPSALPTPLAGSLSPAPPTGTSAADGTGSIAATYSVAQAGLQLAINSSGLTGDTTTVDVVTVGDSEAGTPGVPASLAAGIAGATLPNGSVGSVFLTQAPCVGAPAGCIEVDLDGTFSDGATHLYSNNAPARMTWTCPNSVCPHEDAAHERSKYYNYSSHEQVEDFIDYPLQVSLKTPTGYTPFAQAPSCRDLNDRDQKGLTGKIVAPAASPPDSASTSTRSPGPATASTATSPDRCCSSRTRDCGGRDRARRHDLG